MNRDKNIGEHTIHLYIQMYSFNILDKQTLKYIDTHTHTHILCASKYKLIKWKILTFSTLYSTYKQIHINK